MRGPAGGGAPDDDVEAHLVHLSGRARAATLLLAWAVLGLEVLAVHQDAVPAVRLPLAAYLFLVAPGSCLLVGARMRLPADRLLVIVVVSLLSLSVNVLLAQVLIELGRLGASSYSVGLGTVLLVLSLAVLWPRRGGRQA